MDALEQQWLQMEIDRRPDEGSSRGGVRSLIDTECTARAARVEDCFQSKPKRLLDDLQSVLRCRARYAGCHSSIEAHAGRKERESERPHTQRDNSNRELDRLAEGAIRPTIHRNCQTRRSMGVRVIIDLAILEDL